MRSQFRPDPIPAEVLERLLRAAHHAPSVGFMQPWDFIVIDDVAVKRSVKALHAQANAQAAHNYRDERAELYRQLKLEGIVERPINLCISCDRGRGGGYPTSDEPRHIHLHLIEPGRCTYYLGDVLFDDDPRLTAARRAWQRLAYGGSGIARPQGDARTGWRVQRDIVLGLNVPGYARCGR